MSTMTELAVPIVQNYLQCDDMQLYEQIGILSRAIGRDPALAGSVEPSVVYDRAEMGLKEDVLVLGQRVYRRWNREAYDLLCSSTTTGEIDRRELANAFGISDVAVAAILAGLIVTNFGLAPAIATVIAALVVKRFMRPAYEEFCEVWSKHIAEE